MLKFIIDHLESFDFTMSYTVSPPKPVPVNVNHGPCDRILYAPKKPSPVVTVEETDVDDLFENDQTIVDRKLIQVAEDREGFTVYLYSDGTYEYMP